jgi:hypothetical protein
MRIAGRLVDELTMEAATTKRVLERVPEPHLAWKPETNSNFGAVFPVWDLVFGTFRATPRDGHEHMRLGLNEVRGRDAQRPLWLLTSVTRRRLAAPSPSDASSQNRQQTAAIL